MLNPNIYDRAYFNSAQCEGYVEFKSGRLSPIKQLEIDLLKIEKTDCVLDIGCGRGDIISYLSKMGINFWGVDYSLNAVKLTRKKVKINEQKRVLHDDARKISLPNESVNKILIGDVIEHMTYNEAKVVIEEAFRLLTKSGVCVIHTAPNKAFRKYLVPILKSLLKFYKPLIYKKFVYNIKVVDKYHINEYSLGELNKLMATSSFKKYTVWANRDVLRKNGLNYLQNIRNKLFFRLIAGVINNTPLINLFGNDLFVLAIK